MILRLDPDQAQFLATLLAYYEDHNAAVEDEKHRVDICALLAVEGFFPKYHPKGPSK